MSSDDVCAFNHAIEKATVKRIEVRFQAGVEGTGRFPKKAGAPVRGAGRVLRETPFRARGPAYIIALSTMGCQ